MKQIFLFIILFISGLMLLAQAPEKINYQAVARDLAGNPLVSQTLVVKFEIRQGSSSGSVIYAETHTGITTNQFGLFTTEIGGVLNPDLGIFSSIQWGGFPHHLVVYVNGNLMGNSQLLSVPYALHAKTATSGSTSYWSQSGNTIYNNNFFGAGNVSIGTPLSFGKLTVASPAADSLIASFIGSNPTVSAITISNTSPTGAAGVTFLSGTNITSYVAYSPSTKTLSLVNDVADGHIYINSDSTIVNQTKVIANQADIIANQAQNAIYNNTDTIYNYAPSGAVVHVNQGLFLTDSLYVLGNNFLNPNWILANNGLGQAKWTNPSSLGLGGSLWQSNTPNIYFNTGNVGIGTTNPTAKLDIFYNGVNNQGININYTSTNSSGANSGIFSLAQNTNGGNVFGGYFQVMNSSGSITSTGVKAFNTAQSLINTGVEASATGTGSNNTNYGIFSSAFGGAINEAGHFGAGTPGDGKVYIQDELGIGVAPSTGVKLDVNGDFKLGTQGNINKKYLTGGYISNITLNPNFATPITFTVFGAASSDNIIATLNTNISGGVFISSASVTGSGQVTVYVFNLGPAAITVSNLTLSYIVFK